MLQRQIYWKRNDHNLVIPLVLQQIAEFLLGTNLLLSFLVNRVDKILRFTIGYVSLINEPNSCMRTLFVKVNGKYKGILYSEVLYLEAFKNYVRIHTTKKVIVAHYTLRQIEEHLPDYLFCKIHKSYIIAIDRLTEFDHESVFINEIQLPLAPQHATSLRSRLNIVSHEVRSKVNLNLNGSFSSGS